jgi:hypothetical protein
MMGNRLDIRSADQANKISCWCQRNLKDAEWDLNLMTMFPPHYKFEFKDPHMSTVAALVS